MSEIHHPLAPLWRRLFAMVYDSFLVVAITMFYAAIHVFVKVQIFGAAHIEQSSTAGGDPLMLLGIFASLYLFFYWFWSRNGQTLGMQAWRLRVEQLDGSIVTAKQALLRFIVAPVALLCGGLGYWWALGKAKRSWPDIASNTRVVLLPKRKKD